jgi:hypothetical protein
MATGKKRTSPPRGAKAVIEIIGALARYPKLRKRFRKDAQDTLDFMNRRFKRPFGKVSEMDLQTVVEMTDKELEFLYKLSEAHGTLGDLFAAAKTEDKL